MSPSQSSSGDRIHTLPQIRAFTWSNPQGWSDVFWYLKLASLTLSSVLHTRRYPNYRPLFREAVVHRSDPRCAIKIACYNKVRVKSRKIAHLIKMALAPTGWANTKQGTSFKSTQGVPIGILCGTRNANCCRICCQPV
jgi:hypothetical protein